MKYAILLTLAAAGSCLGQEVRPAVLWESMRPVVWGDWAATGDPLRPQQWGLTAVGEMPPHDPGTPQRRLAVVDTGVANWHEDIPFFQAHTVFADTSPYDDLGHGTHVCGIAVAMAFNDRGPRGVAVAGNHRASSVQALKEGLGTVTTVSLGIMIGASVAQEVTINVSIQGGWEPWIDFAAEYCRQRNSIVVFAAGNYYGGEVSGLARNDYWIVVSSIGEDLTISDFSSIGERVDFCAPGAGVVSCFPFDGKFSFNPVPDNYVYLDGTSMAAPHVSGTIARMRGQRLLTRDQVYNALRYTAIDLGAPGHDPLYGWGLIQAPEALHLVRRDRADINGDGERDVFDIAAYQELFEAGDYRADFDLDGELAEIDYITFLKEHGG